MGYLHRSGDIHVGPIIREIAGSRHRVTATVAGVPVFFESVFAESRPLVESLDRMPPLSRQMRDWIWEPHGERWPLPAEVHDAILRLNERSRRAEPPGPFARVTRRLARLGRKLHQLGRPRLP
jgi:hypothetical protein